MACINLEKISTIEARSNISELINFVCFSGKRITITRRGKPMAVLVSLDDFEDLKKYEEMLNIAPYNMVLEEPVLEVS